MNKWLKTKPMVFFGISLLCNAILAIFYQSPQAGFFLTGLIAFIIGYKDLEMAIEIFAILIWLFFIYLIVEKWHITPPNTTIRDFIQQGIMPVAIGSILGAIDIAMIRNAPNTTIKLFSFEITAQINSFGIFLTNLFSLGTLALILFNTVMILLIYITLYNYKINRDIESRQKQSLLN